MDQTKTDEDALVDVMAKSEPAGDFDVQDRVNAIMTPAEQSAHDYLKQNARYKQQARIKIFIIACVLLVVSYFIYSFLAYKNGIGPTMVSAPQQPSKTMQLMLDEQLLLGLSKPASATYQDAGCGKKCLVVKNV